MRRLASAALLFALASALIITVAAARERVAARCEVTHAAAVFAYPFDFANERFCGEVYFFCDAGLSGFFDRPVDVGALTLAEAQELVVMLPMTALRPRELATLTSGSRVYITGILRPHAGCFTHLYCVPWHKPIYVEQLRIGSRDRRNDQSG